MNIEQIYTSCLSQASYFIEDSGEAAIIDPIRKVDEYIDKANYSKSKIKYVFQTHFHADFVSGHLTLSKRTGAPIVYGPNAEPDYDCIVSSEGDLFKIDQSIVDEEAKKQYREDRKTLYPDLGDQLDDLYHQGISQRYTRVW